jgi:hypothetical protein
LDDREAADLDARDELLDGDLARHDPIRFGDDLKELLAWVRSVGDPLAPEEFAPTDAVLPADDMTLDDVAALLAGQPTPGGTSG